MFLCHLDFLNSCQKAANAMNAKTLEKYHWNNTQIAVLFQPNPIRC
jgi:hypothetical protein